MNRKLIQCGENKKCENNKIMKNASLCSSNITIDECIDFLSKERFFKTMTILKLIAKIENISVFHIHFCLTLTPTHKQTQIYSIFTQPKMCLSKICHKIVCMY